MEQPKWARRILALAIGIGGSIVLSLLALEGNEQALGALILLVGSVVAFYFGAKSAA